MSKFRDKTALALGSAAAVTIAPVAEAALVTVSNSPVSVSFWPTVEVSPLWHNQAVWDVDGVNGPDFALLAQGGKGGTSQNYTLGGGIALNVHSETNPSFSVVRNRLNGEGLVNSSFGYVGSHGAGTFVSALAPLSLSNYVGDSGLQERGLILRGRIAVSETWNYFSTYRLTYRAVLSEFHYNFGGPGTFNIGFKFASGSNSHFGWAQMTIGSGPYYTVSIDEWTYETTPGTPVHVGTRMPDVPVPATIVPALAMLGLGAAGVRRMRKRRAALAEA